MHVQYAHIVLRVHSRTVSGTRYWLALLETRYMKAVSKWHIYIMSYSFIMSSLRGNNINLPTVTQMSMFSLSGFIWTEIIRLSLHLETMYVNCLPTIWWRHMRSTSRRHIERNHRCTSLVLCLAHYDVAHRALTVSPWCSLYIHSVSSSTRMILYWSPLSLIKHVQP
jgi:hypothetical protein